MQGTEYIVSVGDKGTLKVDTKTNLTGASGEVIYLYTYAGYVAGEAPIRSIAASAPTPANGIIQAVLPDNVFPSAGKYVLRAGVTWADGEILGAPAELQVVRGKSS